MRRVLHLGGLVALAAACVLLWPQRWGGTMTYDITRGTSMAPTFHTGDLAVLRRAGDYRIGDVVAYRSPTLHTTVMHRIVAVDHGRYTFRGDHNSFTDPDRLPRAAIVGRLLLHVPKAGLFLGWFVDPVHLAVTIVALALLFGDSRRKQVPRPAPPTVAITGLTPPPGAATADVLERAELERLAAGAGLPVLVDERRATAYVVQGGVLLRHVQREQRPAQPARRSPATGRDWGYSPVVDLQARREVS